MSADRPSPRTLSRQRLMPGELDVLAERLAGDPRLWLPAPARARGVDHWTVDLAAGRVHRRVSCGVGMVWRVGRELWRSLSWQPVTEPYELVAGERALPAFHGRLRLTSDDGGVALVLEGSYRPPAGPLGAALDRMVLHAVAEATADWFLAEVATRLSETRLVVS